MSWYELKEEDVGLYSGIVRSENGFVLNDSVSSISFSSQISPGYALVFWCVLVFIFSLLVWYACSKRDGSGYLNVLLVLIGVLGIYGGFAGMLLWNVPFFQFGDSLREGTFGDSFGTLNALFSGLAFSGVIITVLLQRKDLKEARAQASNQQIESQFYNLLAQQQEVVRGFDLQNKKTNEVIARGRDCFRDWTEGLFQLYAEFSDDSSSQDASNAHNESYDLLFEVYRSDLSLYFRSLYSVFRFIENSGYAKSNEFGRVVRSLLSDYELVLLFYNCLSPRGIKFKRFVSEHALFDNLDPGTLLDKMHVLELSAGSFGQNEDVLVLFPDVP